MPYVPLPLLKAAIDGLRGRHPVAVLVIPAMAKAGVRVVNVPDRGIEYGSRDELQILQQYFMVPAGPQDQPFRAVWEDDVNYFWRDDKYPGRSLQRMRTDQVKAGKGFFQKKMAGDKDLWGLRPNCGPELKDYIKQPVRTADLAIWYGREQDVEDLKALIRWFLHTFPIEQDELVGTVYAAEVPEHYYQIPFSPTPLTQDDYAEALGVPPSPTPIKEGLAELTGSLETCLTQRGFRLSPNLVGRVLSAWTRGDIVVLVGQPGTGKTHFAELIAECLKVVLGDLRVLTVTVRADFDEADMIGYERLDGQPQFRPFTTHVLQSEDPLAPHLVILEEFNLTTLETYLGSILTAIQTPTRRVSLPAGLEARLPVDSFVIATCNSYLDEPETRARISFPAKRRATIITMPNVLYERLKREGDQAIIDLSIDMIIQERERIERRRTRSLATGFDNVRLAALKTVQTKDDLSPEVRDYLVKIAKALLDTPEGREFFTLGLLRDIALSIAYAGRDRNRELDALGQQVADKIVHQLRGPKARADQLVGVTEGLPNHDEIKRLSERAKSGPGDELIPLV